ncbi:MAG: HEAT repeat domain-containing protein [Candidatus Eremiobacterota bacterium]
MKFKVIADIQGNFMVEEREEDFEIACPFCENIDIYQVNEDTDLYCSKCGKLLVIKGKGRTCFDFEDVTKLKNIIKRGTSREDRRNALILLGRVLEWCEDLTLAEFLLHLSLMDPDKWVRERAEQILNQQREAGTAKVKSEIKKLKTSQHPPPLSVAEEESVVQEEIPAEDLSDREEISEQKEDIKKANLVDILLEVIDDTQEVPFPQPNVENINNIDELLEVAMGSIESTKEVLEGTCETPKRRENNAEIEEEEIREEIREETEETQEETEEAQEEIEETQEETEEAQEEIEEAQEEIEEEIEEVEKEIEEQIEIKEEIEEAEKEIEEQIENIKTEEEIERDDEMEDEIKAEASGEHKSLTEDVDDITAQELLDKPIEDLLDGITIESLLEEFALSEDFSEKADIIFIMGEMKFLESTEFLLDLMQNDPDYELRLISLQALEKIGDKSIAPAILESMKKEKDTDFRKKIATFYSQLKYKRNA